MVAAIETFYDSMHMQLATCQQVKLFSLSFLLLWMKTFIIAGALVAAIVKQFACVISRQP